MKSLFKTVALITIFSAITRVLGFLFHIYLSRQISAEALGLYQVASSVFMVLLTIISSGLPLIISRKSAYFRAGHNYKDEGALVSSGLIFALAESLLIALIILVFKEPISQMFANEGCIDVLIALLVALITSSVYSVLRGSLWGRNNYFALCTSELFEQVLRICICLLILSSSLSVVESATAVAWSLSFACIGSAIFVVLLFFLSGGRLGKPKRPIFRELVRQSTPITGIRVASSLLQPVIAILLPARLVAAGYTSSQALSLYGVAVGMTLPLLYVPNTILGSLSTALVPDISTAVAKNDKGHVEARAKNSINFAIAISALFVPLYMGLGEQIGLFLFDSALSGSLLTGASCLMLFMGVGGIVSSLLNSLGLEIRAFINYIIGAILMFIAMWFLPAIIGINALIFGMGISQIVTTILNLRLLRKKAGIKVPVFRPLALSFVAALPTAAFASFLGGILQHFMPTFFVIVISGGLSIVFMIAISLAIGLFDIKMAAMFVKRFLPAKRGDA